MIPLLINFNYQKIIGWIDKGDSGSFLIHLNEENKGINLSDYSLHLGISVKNNGLIEVDCVSAKYIKELK